MADGSQQGPNAAGQFVLGASSHLPSLPQTLGPVLLNQYRITEVRNPPYFHAHRLTLQGNTRPLVGARPVCMH